MVNTSPSLWRIRDGTIINHLQKSIGYPTSKDRWNDDMLDWLSAGSIEIKQAELSAQELFNAIHRLEKLLVLSE